ncbi:hypothetical protein [Gulosibacter bifidus]|uniref:Ferritin-like diiron domain-containing protein n=1 Tax=Gulosibacter bifidus TaxID=272239 RepID=A0ABW5RGF6_9MICO|nr:hypothetical protein [Gulosibacter bifidus]
MRTAQPAPGASGSQPVSPGKPAAETLIEADKVLQYVIEAEKLAHDVYAALYAQYNRENHLAAFERQQ